MSQPGLHTIVAGDCLACGKRGYRDRAHARYAAKTGLRGHRLHAYRCHDDPTWWHLGHLPWTVVAGLRSRDELAEKATA